MILAFVIAAAVAILFVILWSEEKEKRELAEMKIRQLAAENRRLKSKAGPAAVERSRKAKGFAIPKPEKRKDEPLLDKGKLAALQAQTKAAQAMLAEIFVPEEEKEHDPVRESDMNPLMDFLCKLMAKEQWTRSELTELVGPDVMLGNLLEQVNDYAYTRVNDVVVEEDDNNIYVTTAYKEQLI